MEKILIQGGNRLNGAVAISGMKNSALPIIFSCLLIKGDCIITNVPQVTDVENALEILRSMGAVAKFCGKNTVLINTKDATSKVGAYDLICKMRASSYLMGTMLSRFGEVEIPMPGGCDFGTRPIDLHLKGFEKLGADCTVEDGKIKIKAPKKLKSSKITLDKISVGATINMVLASLFVDGSTIIQNCACEPHIDDLLGFLNKCGANIKRIGNTIVCLGVKWLYGTKYRIFPDMIEALTYICYVGICGGKIEILRVVPSHLLNELILFHKMGFLIEVYKDRLCVSSDVVYGTSVSTSPYPLFPTDLHPQFASLLCFSKGGGAIREEVFASRFAYVKELKKMGAFIDKIGNTVYVRQSQLKGCSLNATDLRAGAALVGASLGALGESTIDNVHFIVRGYENLVEKIANIGGKIKLIKE